MKVDSERNDSWHTIKEPDHDGPNETQVKILTLYVTLDHKTRHNFQKLRFLHNLKAE